MPTTRTAHRSRRAVPAALVALSVVPIAAGAVRVSESGGRVSAPVLAHVVGATVFCVLGAFQFAPGPRRTRRHRVAGRVTVVAGLVAALTGLWLAVFPAGPAGVLLTGLRLVFGSAMACAIGLGVAAVRRGDLGAHRAWQTRGYAIGLGAGTQAFTVGLWVAFAGPPGASAEALLIGAGWVVNLAVAERFVRKPRHTRRSDEGCGSGDLRFA